jgi:hypothetical protein
MIIPEPPMTLKDGSHCWKNKFYRYPKPWIPWLYKTSYSCFGSRGIPGRKILSKEKIMKVKIERLKTRRKFSTIECNTEKPSRTHIRRLPKTIKLTTKKVKTQKGRETLQPK